MTGPPLYVIASSRIVFGRDGCWYVNGAPVTNQRIALLLSRHLVRRPDGSHAVVVGREEAAVEIEDTPWVVTEVDGDGKRGFLVTLNDQTCEPLDPGSLSVGPDNAFSCSVKGGMGRARFLRSAHHHLAWYVEAAEEPGEFAIEVQGRRYSVATEEERS